MLIKALRKQLSKIFNKSLTAPFSTKVLKVILKVELIYCLFIMEVY